MTGRPVTRRLLDESLVGRWTARCMEQLGDNRIVRPRSRYVGSEGRTWTPLEER